MLDATHPDRKPMWRYHWYRVEMIAQRRAQALQLLARLATERVVVVGPKHRVVLPAQTQPDTAKWWEWP